jgi:hypothetical protein
MNWKNKELKLKIDRDKNSFLIAINIEGDSIYGTGETFSDALVDLAEGLRLGGL